MTPTPPGLASGFGSLPEIAASLRGGALSAVELAEAAIERHASRGDRLSAYKHFDAEGALAAARAADAWLASDGDAAPPLAGIPVSIKDIYGVEGMPTFAGTPRQLPATWSRDAWLVARLRGQAAVFVGKTHTVEMAFAGVGMNPNWETPWNPWDAEVARIPGGSSSGAGVSLWEGSALVALGSDTGGSIRIPAAFTGTVGHKTTKGRWPTTGVVPLSHTFDTVGALTRTVVDSAYFFGAVDPELGDPAAFLARLAGTDLATTRVAIPRCEIAKSCEPHIGDVIHDALGELSTAGAELVEIDGALIDQAVELYMTGGIGGTECRTFLEQQLPGWLEILHPIVGSRLATAVSPHDPAYEHALSEQRRLAASAGTLFERADVIALPANLITPPPVSDLDDFNEIRDYLRVNAMTLRPTCPVNLLGLCAVSIPVGLDAAGMPVGLQLVAPAGRDEELLGVALAAERVLGTATERLGTPPAIAG
jgi:aspartyl-tRNA(Asn)/glutamyl-tRNA(Gln) amidotransferase subunit A